MRCRVREVRKKGGEVRKLVVRDGPMRFFFLHYSLLLIGSTRKDVAQGRKENLDLKFIFIDMWPSDLRH